MSKHTAGPWIVREIDLHEGGKGVEVVAGDGEVICDNQTYYPQALDPRNARLIAAAPDLLDALQVISSYPEPDQLEMRRIARAAIAKATGDHP